MPQRVLRDWTLSDKINQLSPEGERFFVRLIMQADDYGRFYGDPRILKARLFPLLDIRKTDIARWITEVTASGVVRSYTAEGKEYLEIVDFGQRLRQKTALFPEPCQQDTDTCPQLADTCQQDADNRPPEEEVEEKIEEKNSPFIIPPPDGGGKETGTEPSLHDRLKATLNSLYNRKPTTMWTEKEVRKLREIEKRPEAEAEMEEIAALYLSGYEYGRKDIITLLNNWGGELDRARARKKKKELAWS